MVSYTKLSIIMGLYVYFLVGFPVVYVIYREHLLHIHNLKSELIWSNWFTNVSLYQIRM